MIRKRLGGTKEMVRVTFEYDPVVWHLPQQFKQLLNEIIFIGVLVRL